MIAFPAYRSDTGDIRAACQRKERAGFSQQSIDLYYSIDGLSTPTRCTYRYPRQNGTGGHVRPAGPRIARQAGLSLPQTRRCFALLPPCAIATNQAGCLDLPNRYEPGWMLGSLFFSHFFFLTFILLLLLLLPSTLVSFSFLWCSVTTKKIVRFGCRRSIFGLNTMSRQSRGVHVSVLGEQSHFLYANHSFMFGATAPGSFRHHLMNPCLHTKVSISSQSSKPLYVERTCHARTLPKFMHRLTIVPRLLRSLLVVHCRCYPDRCSSGVV